METIQKILICDTHFGVKNNSIHFLNSQLSLFDDLTDYMKTCKNDRFDLVHLGDIFESRSSVSIYILNEVKNLLFRLNTILKSRNENNRFIFVAGNHDFYSPISDEVNSLDTIIKDVLPDAMIVSQYCWYDNGDIYIPWYQMNDSEKFELVKKQAFNNPKLSIKRIFTHCDCHNFQYGQIPVNATLYSGHIHQYHEYMNMLSSNPNSKLYNLSTPYSLDYGDSNDNRKGFWTLDGLNLTLHENMSSIKFRTFVNDQIFDIDDLYESIERGDNFRIYISTDNQSKIEYIERLNELSSSIKYITTIPINNNINNINEAITSLDINNMLMDMIPEHLQDNFNIIKSELHNEN